MASSENGILGSYLAALRENGKFILVITLDDLCKMLLGADAGSGPRIVSIKEWMIW